MRAGNKFLNHHMYFMGCLCSSLLFCADTRISHLLNAVQRTTLNAFLSLPFLFRLGSICHFNTSNTNRFEEDADFTGQETIIKKKENLSKRGVEELGGRQKRGKQASSWSFCFFEGNFKIKSNFIFLENLIGLSAM